VIKLNYDVTIKNGLIIDGTGSPWFRGDIAIEGEKIVNVGRVDSKEADVIIDASGLVVSPGFIDIHSHSEFQLLINPQADSLVRQGITTVINGVCGFSAAPVKKEYMGLVRTWGTDVLPDWTTFQEYYERLDGLGITINTGSLVGLANVRVAAMGEDAWDRTPTDSELEAMKCLVSEAMGDGAFGLSSGLEYPPQTIATTNEIIELAKIAAKHGGIYVTHIRSRDVKLVSAAEEAIEIGEKAGIPVEGSHFGARFPSDGKTKVIVDLSDKARDRGVDIAFDQIPWTTDEKGLSWIGLDLLGLISAGSKYTAKGNVVTLEMLKDSEVVEHLCEDLPNRQFGPILAGSRGLLSSWDRVVLIQCKGKPQLNGKNFAEIGEIMEADPFDALIDILVSEGDDFRKVWGKVALTTQWDTNFSLLHPFCSVTADTGIDSTYGPLSEKPINVFTTRAYGSFPYFLEKWVKEDGLLTLEDAIRKCSGLPAQRMRIMDRGLLRPGMYADIVIFDPEKIKRKSTFEEPRRYPEGIEKVLVNGGIVVDQNTHRGTRGGKVLRL